MSVKKAWVEEGCTSCGLCEDIAPDVFEIDDVSEVKSGADFAGNSDDIIEAAENCPVEVIQYEED